MHKLIPILSLGLVFASCQQHPAAASLSSISPDGKTVIHVNAKKQTALDPFTVVMDLKTGTVDQGSLQFEIVASVIDSTDVRFDWADPQNATITFTQSDGEKRVFAYYGTSSSVMLREIKKE